MGLYSNPLFTGVFGPLTGTTSVTETPTQSSQIAGEQTGLMGVLNGMLNPATDPTLAPIKAASMDQINRNYAALPNKVTAQAAARGFGSSGKVGGGLLGVESSRLGDLSGLSAIQQLLNLLKNGGKASPGAALPSIPYQFPSSNPSGGGYGSTSGGDGALPSMDYQSYNDGLPSMSYQSPDVTSTVSYPSDPSYNPVQGDA